MRQHWVRPLQIAVAVFGLVPVGAGLAGVFLGPAPFDHAIAGFDARTGLHEGTGLDSHFRYLSGLLLAIGLVFWSLIPGITKNGDAFRLLTLLVVVGGLGRLVGVVARGFPPPPMAFGLVMELIVTPLLCLWQARVATAPNVLQR